MITVLRLGHRRTRDKRISPHVGLVARAFGADKIIFSGEKDESLLTSLKNVVREWGGNFEIEYSKDWKKIIQDFNGKTVQLTMYGIPHQKKVSELRNKNLLIIVGSGKVPGEVYHIVDYNLSITTQPHSEVAALGVFLHDLLKGKKLNRKFSNWKIKVIPDETEKNIVRG